MRFVDEKPTFDRIAVPTGCLPATDSRDAETERLRQRVNTLRFRRSIQAIVAYRGTRILADSSKTRIGSPLCLDDRVSDRRPMPRRGEFRICGAPACAESDSTRCLPSKVNVVTTVRFAALRQRRETVEQTIPRWTSYFCFELLAARVKPLRDLSLNVRDDKRRGFN